MRDFNWDAFWTGVLGALTLLGILVTLGAVYGVVHNAAYNEGFRRGAYVEQVCPQNRTFHCPLGGK